MTNEELAIRYQRGDDRAGEQLVKQCEGFIWRLATKYRTVHLQVEDHLQDGRLGLIKAARCYDPSRGYKFLTFAHHWVRQFIQRGTELAEREIRLPHHVLADQVKREAAAAVIGSLNEETGDDDRSWLDVLADQSALDPEDEAIRNEEYHEALRRLVYLSSVERQVVLLYAEHPSLADVARLVGKSREWARQVHTRAMKKLKVPIQHPKPQTQKPQRELKPTPVPSIPWKLPL